MPADAGKHYLVVAREDFSGYAEARALGKANSKNIAAFIWEDIICRHGCFRKLVVDGGPENQKYVERLAERYNIKGTVVSAFHPQANGMIERGHQPIVDALSKMSKDSPRGWTRNLQAVLWADRAAVRRSTGMTPALIVCGTDAILPIELDILTWQILPWLGVNSTAYLLALRARQIERRDEDVEEALLHLRRVRKQSKE